MNVYMGKFFKCFSNKGLTCPSKSNSPFPQPSGGKAIECIPHVECISANFFNPVSMYSVFDGKRQCFFVGKLSINLFVVL